MRVKTPCYVCQERHPGCHAGCEKYKAWSEAHQTKKQKRYRAFEAERKLDDFIVDSARKLRKRATSAKKRAKL